MRRSEILFTLSRIILDGAMIFAGLILAYFLRMEWFGMLGLSAPTTLYPLEAFSSFSLKVTCFLLLVLGLNGRYRFYSEEKIWDEIYSIFWAFSAGMALLVVFFFFSKFIFFSRFILGTAWLMGLILVISGRIILRYGQKHLYQKGLFKDRLLLIGSGSVVREAINILQNTPRYECIGILTEQPSSQKTFEGLPILGSLQNFDAVLKDQLPHEVLMASEDSTTQISSELVNTAHRHHAKFRYLPDELGMDLAAVRASTFGHLPVINLLNTQMDGWAYVIKSALDYLGALALTILLSPVMVFIAYKIRKEDPKAPIFYISQRIGRKGKSFRCFKFRTMVPNADELKQKLKSERKGLFKLKDDPRITQLGKTLREWSLDELPQLWNVLRGEMSLIGPRPHLPEEVKKYDKNDLQLLSIKPGISGFAQINGRSSLSLEEEMRYELFYLKNWSLWLDTVIFIKTIHVVVKRENAS